MAGGVAGDQSLFFPQRQFGGLVGGPRAGQMQYMAGGDYQLGGSQVMMIR